MYNKDNKSKNIIRNFFLYIYTFFIIYMPRISELLIDIPIEFFSVVLLFLMIIPWLMICKKSLYNFKINKNLFLLITGVIISIIYFSIRAILSSNEIRILQNAFIIVQVIHIVFIIDLMKTIGYKKDDMIKVLLNLGLVQGTICFFMLIFPQFRNIALDLYYLGGEENIFISRMRIYGISGDYTYFTPIYHGMLASVAFFYSIFKNKKYLIYIPFIMISIMLNGRFGLLIFLLSPLIVLSYFLIKRKISWKVIRYSTALFILITLAILVLRIVSPYTYDWIVSGFQDTINLAFNKEISGNYTALVNDMLYFPKGVKYFVGEGHRVYSYQGISRGYNASDIGYVNDLFMGGLVYIFILYGTIFRFILGRKSEEIISTKSDFYINGIIPIFLVNALLLSNYKGESMRGGLILLGAIFIKLILRQPSSD